MFLDDEIKSSCCGCKVCAAVCPQNAICSKEQIAFCDRAATSADTREGKEFQIFRLRISGELRMWTKLCSTKTKEQALSL